jgi:hypothetical protein
LRRHPRLLRDGQRRRRPQASRARPHRGRLDEYDLWNPGLPSQPAQQSHAEREFIRAEILDLSSIRPPPVLYSSHRPLAA